MKHLQRFLTIFACGFGVVAVVTGEARGQIVDFMPDKVLSAPYRGTINSLREATLDMGYGEVRTLVEPHLSGSLNPNTSFRIWLEPGSAAWDRSVLRMYHEVDASGLEIDLTNPSARPRHTLSHHQHASVSRLGLWERNRSVR